MSDNDLWMLQGIKQGKLVLKLIPLERRSYETCLESVKVDGSCLKDIPMRFHTHEMYLEAVRVGGYNLQFIPYDLRMYDICVEAVKGYSSVCRYVPQEFVKRLYDEEEMETVVSSRLFSLEELLGKYSIEELLTSSKSYMRDLGMRGLKGIL